MKLFDSSTLRNGAEVEDIVIRGVVKALRALSPDQRLSLFNYIENLDNDTIDANDNFDARANLDAPSRHRILKNHMERFRYDEIINRDGSFNPDILSVIRSSLFRTEPSTVALQSPIPCVPLPEI